LENFALRCDNGGPLLQIPSSNAEGNLGRMSLVFVERKGMRGRLTYFDANDRLVVIVDTPKRKGHYLAWCGERGFEPIGIGVVG
jgi:hypothetical protein